MNPKDIIDIMSSNSPQNCGRFLCFTYNLVCAMAINNYQSIQ
jgi:hypothetical protein